MKIYNIVFISDNLRIILYSIDMLYYLMSCNKKTANFTFNDSRVFFLFHKHNLILLLHYAIYAYYAHIHGYHNSYMYTKG